MEIEKDGQRDKEGNRDRRWRYIERLRWDRYTQREIQRGIRIKIQFRVGNGIEIDRDGMGLGEEDGGVVGMGYGGFLFLMYFGE